MYFDAVAFADDPPTYRLLRKIGKALERGEPGQAHSLCTELVAIRPDNVDALIFLGADACRSDRITDASELASRALAARPDDAIAQILLGRCDADADTKLRAYCDGLTRAADSNVLDRIAQMPVIGEIVREAMDEVDRKRQSVIDAALAPVRAKFGADSIAKIDHAVDTYLGRKPVEWPHPLQRPTFMLVPGLPPQPWFEREQFPFLERIEAQTDAIREEMLAVLEDESRLSPYVDMRANAPAEPIWRALNRSPAWSAYHLYRYGERKDANCARCPRTIAALDSIPIMRIEGHSPEAMYSILRPRTAIPPHTGVINGRLTVHLPLVVPENCGKLVAGGEGRAWEVGKCLIFDDSMAHEAYNNSDQTRVVLIFDVWNPYLSEAEREGLAAAVAVIGAFNDRYGGRGTRE